MSRPLLLQAHRFITHRVGGLYLELLMYMFKALGIAGALINVYSCTRKLRGAHMVRSSTTCLEAEHFMYAAQPGAYDAHSSLAWQGEEHLF